MPVDIERSRNEYRERYRDYHENGLTNHSKNDNRPKRGHYHDDNHPGNYSSRTSPSITKGYTHHPSRASFNSRNGSLTHHRHHDDYPSLHISSSSSSNRIGNGNGIDQSNYYDNHSSSSRFDRQSNKDNIYSSLQSDQPILSGGSPLTSSYYNSSQSIPPLRDRGVPPSYVDSERSQYPPPPPYRRDSSPLQPPSSSYRNNGSDLYIRDEYRSPTPPILASVSVRNNVDSYSDMYRSIDYNNRSERYDIPPNRNGSSRDYSSSVYRIPLSSSSYVVRDQYTPVQEVNYRMTSSMDRHQSVSNNSSRNSSNNHNHDDYHLSSYRERPNLKRSRRNFNDNGPIPFKRVMRR